MSTQPMGRATLGRATLDDLMKVDGRAELIDGRIVLLGACGYLTGRTAKRIILALGQYADDAGCGEVGTAQLAYIIDPPLASGRQSFSPFVSYFTGEMPADLMKPISGPPTFAAEVRSENDYGPAKEREHAEKRTDYFAAGTLVVWDVDPLAETVSVYTAAAPTAPAVFRRGEVADAEPAVPGWRLPVDALFA